MPTKHTATDSRNLPKKHSGMSLDIIRPAAGNGKKVYMETYGCQMNVADSGIILSILGKEGYARTDDMEQADIILVNTCSVRDNAERRVRGRIGEFARCKQSRRGVTVGVVGCMAERLSEVLLREESAVDFVAGPDSYHDLPRLIEAAAAGTKSANTILSAEETYADVKPVRIDPDGVSAFVSIMRGCNNFCSYCVVPYTRGRERSRGPQSVIAEAQNLFGEGVREITLLGQNVNSYRREDAAGKTVDFPDLLTAVADISPLLRVRFATSHPKDLSDRLLDAMASRPNICRAIHLPAQSGSGRMLEKMNRKYTREWYLERVTAIRSRMPDCGITTDLIAGFCGETDEDHRQTLSLMREVGYDSAYMFRYSPRPRTLADRTMPDDVPDSVKGARLTEIINLQNELSLESNRRDIGKCFEVLAEGPSKRDPSRMCGRTSQNKMTVFPAGGTRPGDYVTVKIENCTQATLTGVIIQET